MPAAAAAFAVLGLLIGSFAGVIAHRLPIGESFVTGRSRCDSCGQEVAADDNIPVVSWLLLRGRCRHCGASIPARYPLIEAGLGAAFAAVYLVLEDQGAAEVALGLVFVTTLAIITLTDLEDRIIPNTVLIAATVVGLAIVVAFLDDQLGERLIAAAAAGGGLLLVALAYPRGMGMGDVKLAGVMGLYLGSAVAPALLIGFLTGSLLGIALIARHGAEARKQAVPFGPFLALGGLIGLLAGDEMVDWYTNTFLSG
jgi:leader peptidase (prepilin peptidase)/N-methyltransferase